MIKRIAFQGEPGAYSHEACVASRPDHEALPCNTFEEVIDAVREGRADLAMLPVENSTYGRVADIHRLLPESGLHIVDEAFVRVRIALMALPGMTLDRIDHVRAHLVLIPQARSFLKRRGRRRQRRCGRRAGAAPHAGAGGAGVRPGGADLRVGRAGAQHRGSRPQHHPFPGHGARTRHAPPRQPWP